MRNQRIELGREEESRKNRISENVTALKILTLALRFLLSADAAKYELHGNDT